VLRSVLRFATCPMLRWGLHCVALSATQCNIEDSARVVKTQHRGHNPKFQTALLALVLRYVITKTKMENGADTNPAIIFY